MDGGKTWLEAHDYIKENKDPGAKVFSWTLWKYNLNIYEQLAPGQDHVKLLVRAIGSDGEVQSGRLEDKYNIRGIMNNALHEVTFNLK